MRERRALRFVVEALFLGALAAALVFADLEPLVIAGVMLVGWLIVALFEWAATRELPHYGRGLPPRYYVPQVALPPPRQLEQLRSGYPAASADDQATWIAPAAMREEALADWPVTPAVDASPGEDTMVVDDLALVTAGQELFHENTWIELDPIAEGREEVPVVEAVLTAEVVEEVVVEAVVEPEPEPEAVEEPEPVAEVEPVVEPEPEVIAEPEPEQVAEVEPVAEPEPEPEAIADPEPEPEPVAEVEPEPVAPVPAEVVEELAVVAVAAAVVEPDPEEPEEVHGDTAVVAAALAAGALVARPDDHPAHVPAAEPEDDDIEEDAVPAPPEAEAPVPVPERSARHTFDPFAAESHARRRWRRRDDPYVELPARPPFPSALPGTSRRESHDEAPA